MRLIVALVAAAGLATPALAQITSIIQEASIDGGNTWNSSVNAMPGSTVQVRVRATLTGATSLGLTGFTFQPLLSNWRADLGDVRVPFTFPGLSSTIGPTYGLPLTETSFNGRHVADQPGNTGRIFPMGAAGMLPASASGLLTSFNDPGNVLRFAGSKNTTATTNIAWGVNLSQWPPVYMGTSFDSRLDLTVFKYAVQLSTDPTARDLHTSAPASYFSAGHVIYWYTLANGLDPLRTPASAAVFQDATIHVPAPGAWAALAGVLGANAVRRRRAGATSPR